MVFYGTFRFGIGTIQYFLILVLVLFGILWYFHILVLVLFGILWYFQISVLVLFGILWYFQIFVLGLFGILWYSHILAVFSILCNFQIFSRQWYYMVFYGTFRFWYWYFLVLFRENYTLARKEMELSVTI